MDVIGIRGEAAVASLSAAGVVVATTIVPVKGAADVVAGTVSIDGVAPANVDGRDEVVGPSVEVAADGA